MAELNEGGGESQGEGDEAKLTVGGTGSKEWGRPTRPDDPVGFDPYWAAFDLPPIPPKGPTPTEETDRFADEERQGYADDAEAVARLMARMAAIPDPDRVVTPWDGDPQAKAAEIRDREELAEEFGLTGTIAAADDDPPDPITPAEAAEELDDQEADELASDDPPAPARDRTWAEYDAYIEADRRFHLDTIGMVSAVLTDHTRPMDDDSEGETRIRTEAAPPWLEADIREFLRAAIRLGRRAVARLEGGDQ